MSYTVYGAAYDNDIDGVRRLLAAGRPVDEPDPIWYNRTTLHHTALFGYTAIAEVLISANANVNATDRNLNTPLHLAAWNGHTSVADLLLKHGVDITAVDKDQDTPLHEAAWNGHTPIVQLLLCKGANVNAVDIVSMLLVPV
ncbi:uncharacterized protein LOC144346261 [Saccoglossus kowalevskii]